MNDPKPFASLGPTLLARKGGAKPAMRPQTSNVGAVTSKVAAQNLEDLGWNDMGEEDAAADHSADILQLTPAPHNPKAEALTDKGSPKPKVRTMHEELAERLAQAEGKAPREAPAIPLRKHAEPVRAGNNDDVSGDREPVADEGLPPAATRGPATQSSRRAAFTLRLDSMRHLKLRLASTVRNRSAQQLVTEALDRFLNDIPELEVLARQVQRDGNRPQGG
jgi:hypothetical protein